MDLFGAPDHYDDEPEDAGDDELFKTAPSLHTDDAPAGPRSIFPIIGHSQIEDILLEAYNSGRMPHGMIFTGPKGIGKASIAYRLARFLLKSGIPDDTQNSLFGGPSEKPASLDIPAGDQIARLVASGAHPDLLICEREFDEDKNRQKATLAIEEIRKIGPFLRKTSSMGGWRIVIVDDADTMTRNAQNALLKILEEPPPATLIILICHRMGTMVPTVRSRCRLYNFHPLHITDFSSALSQNGQKLAIEEVQALHAMTGGSIGRALELKEAGGLETLSAALDILALPPTGSWPQIHRYADQFGKAGDDKAFEQLAGLLPWVYRQIIIAKSRNTALNPGIFGHNEALESLLRHSSLESLLKICENLEDLFANVAKSNLDKKQAVLSAYAIINA